MCHYFLAVVNVWWTAGSPLGRSLLDCSATFALAASPYFVLQEEVAACVCCRGIIPISFIFTFEIRMNAIWKWTAFLIATGVVRGIWWLV